MRKLLLALCLPVMLLSFAACCWPDIAGPSDLTDLSIAGNKLEGYTIIYARSPFSYAQAARFNTEWDFYKVIAEDVADKLYAATGVKLPVKQDTKTEVSKLEILIGPTNRSESFPLDGLQADRTYAKVVGSKLVLGGGYNTTRYTGNLKTSYCFAASYHAFDAIETYLDENFKNGNKTLNLSSGTDFSKTIDLITVGCIGDSITEGVGASDMNVTSYPAVLQRILWKDHLVINLGFGGRTMREDLDASYRGTDRHSAMMQYADEFDYALIMLGTNDSYFDMMWSELSDEKYLTSADALVGDLMRENTDMQVVIMNCPTYYGGGPWANPRVLYLQNQLPKRLEDQGVNTSFFDMNTYTAQNVGGVNFPDQLHPNDTGYAKMAWGLSEMLNALEDGSYTYTLPTIEGGELAQPPKRSEVAEGSTLLLSGGDLSAHYPIATGPYAAWGMDGAPYLFMDQNLFSGYTITNIEFPVASVKAGSTLTVSVVKYNHPRVTETLATYTLTATEACSAGWLGFDGLSIEVPAGYTLAFGTSSDLIAPLYLTTKVPGYGFYSSGHNGICADLTLAFNIYGRQTDE